MNKKRKITASFLVFLLYLTVLGGIDVSFAAGNGTNSADTAAQSSSKGLLHEEQFSSNHSMSGVFSQFTEYFETGDWEINSAAVTLRYTVTQLEDSEISSITLSLNGQAFYSQRVGPDVDGKVWELKAKIPVESIVNGQNSLTVNTYLRSKDCSFCSGTATPSDKDGVSCCTDDNSGTEWMQIKKESSVSLEYLPKAGFKTVADFCKQFVSIDALEYKQSELCVRKDADNTELAAASLILAGISGQAKMYYSNIGFAAINNEADLYSGKFRIFISKYDHLTADISESLTQEEKQAAQRGAAIVLLGGKNDSNVLLLTGNNDNALFNAAKLIDNSSYLSQIQTTWRSVSEDENVLTPKTELNQFKQLTTSGVSLKGRGAQSSSFYIEMPNNRKLIYSSTLSLSMRYSDNLDFSRAMVTAYINDKPIGSKSLEKDKAQGDTAVFDIPSDMDVNGNFTVSVKFDLEDYHNCCACTADLLPWAWISSDSTLKIVSENVDTLLFENYPGPFIKDGELNNVVIVLPDTPHAVDFEALRLILLTMGRSLESNTGTLRIANASSAGDISNSNIICIGSYSQNQILQANNDRLFFKFSADGSTLSSNEKMLIDPNYGKNLGTVQLLVSPYSKGKYAFMAVTGVSDEAMLRGVKYIGSTDNMWKIYGDGFVADGTNVYPYRFKIDNAKTESVVKQVLTRTDIRNVALVAGIIIIIALVSVVLLFRKYRKTRKGD